MTAATATPATARTAAPSLRIHRTPITRRIAPVRAAVVAAIAVVADATADLRWAFSDFEVDADGRVVAPARSSKRAAR